MKRKPAADQSRHSIQGMDLAPRAPGGVGQAVHPAQADRRGQRSGSAPRRARLSGRRQHRRAGAADPARRIQAAAQRAAHAEAEPLGKFRKKWCDREDRHALLHALPGREAAAHLLREIQNQEPYDLYDGWQHSATEPSPSAALCEGTARLAQQDARQSPRGRHWLASQFACAAPTPRKASSLFELPRSAAPAASPLSNPAAVVHHTKERLFAV